MLLLTEKERGGKEQRKNGEREKNVSAPNGPAPENRYGRTDERGMGGGRKAAKMGFFFFTRRGRHAAGTSQAETSTKPWQKTMIGLCGGNFSLR